MERETRVSHGLDERQHDREVLGAATGHHRIDGGLLNGQGAAAVDVLDDHLVGGSPSRVQKAADAGRGGGYNGQSISPPLLVAELDRVFGVGDIQYARRKPGVWSGHSREAYRVA